MLNIKSKPLLVDLFKFLKSPNYNITIKTDKARNKVWDIFQLWSFFMALIVIIAIIISISLSFFSYDLQSHKVVEFFTDQPIIIFILFAYIWAPIVEEIIFRLWFKYSPWKIAIPISFILILIFNALRFYYSEFFQFIPWWFFNLRSLTGITTVIIFVLIFSFILKTIFEKYLKTKIADKFFDKYFIYIFYSSTIIFGASHIFNFNQFWQLWFLIPLLVMPQLILSAGLGYIRMRYGFSWSMITHFLDNFLLSLPAVSLTILAPDIMKSYQDPESLEMISMNDQIILLTIFSIIILIIFFIIISLFSLFKEVYNYYK